MDKTKPYLTTKDYSVSGETFQLIYNVDLDILETFPKPKDENLSAYYKSEDYISHTNAKRNVFEWVYQFIRNIALKRKLNLINSFQTETKKVLDVGCGTGHFLEKAQANGWQITGIEPNANARVIANKKTNNSVFDTSELQHLQPNSFDVITLWHVLEHLPNLKEQIRQLKALLKPNGRLVVAVPNYKSYDASHYKSYWAAYDVPRHLWHFSPKGIQNVFSKFNMHVLSQQPMTFDAYYVSLLSEKYKTGLMNPFKAFWIGWRSNYKAKRTKDYSSLIYILKKT